MGMHYVNKLLLLNESDIMVKGQSPETSFADLWELAEEHGSMYQSEYEFPLCSVLGFTSERFDETILWDDYCEPNCCLKTQPGIKISCVYFKALAALMKRQL